MAISENIADVGLKLLRETGPLDQNSFLSPVSIACALAMTYAGADGNTKAEMNKVLFTGMSDEEVHSEFSKLMGTLNPADAQYQLRNVNRIYAQQGFTLMDKFKAILDTQYKAELHLANFASEAEVVRCEINSFVSKQTNNKINDLIGAGVLDALTRLVLVNAIYFKGDWANKFEQRMTQDMPFYITEKEEKKVPMMIARGKEFHYGENNDVQVLGMPYKGEELMFVAVLPKKKCNLQEVESKMNGKMMVDLIRSMRERKVDVYLPKFKLEKSFSLNDALKKLGAVDMFTGDADFSGMNGNKNDLYVSAVIHKAFIEVNEEGSEAAAAIAVVMTKECAMRPSPTPQFKADHPFLFAIVQPGPNTVIFFGRHYSQ